MFAFDLLRAVQQPENFCWCGNNNSIIWDTRISKYIMSICIIADCFSHPFTNNPRCFLRDCFRYSVFNIGFTILSKSPSLCVHVIGAIAKINSLHGMPGQKPTFPRWTIYYFSFFVDVLCFPILCHCVKKTKQICMCISFLWLSDSIEYNIISLVDALLRDWISFELLKSKSRSS